MIIENGYAEELKRRSVDPIPTLDKTIEGIGTVKVYGVWDAEKLIKRLLKNESITG